MTYFIVKVNGKILRIKSFLSSCCEELIVEDSFDLDDSIKVWDKLVSSMISDIEKYQVIGFTCDKDYQVQIGDVFEFIDVETLTVIETYTYKG